MLTKKFFMNLTVYFIIVAELCPATKFIDYAPGEPKIPLGSETPKEYLSLALYLTLPVSKSPSIAVVNGALLNILYR